MIECMILAEGIFDVQGNMGLFLCVVGKECSTGSCLCHDQVATSVMEYEF